MNDPVELRTKWLLLRPSSLADADDIAHYARDPEWARYIPVLQPYTRRDAEEFVAGRVLVSWETDPA